jgi:hypothetical protein
MQLYNEIVTLKCNNITLLLDFEVNRIIYLALNE